ncbi:MAG: alpha/beta hydrolase [Clostridia bacterium]|nr:alpha/beta hydrolase [Clostridia bacterium]
MKISKKLLALALVAALAVCACAPLYASAEGVNPYPVIYVDGLATSDIINTETGEVVFPFSQETITTAVKNIIGPTLRTLITGKYELFGDPLLELADTIFGPMALDGDGNPVYPTTNNPRDNIDLTQDFKRYFIPGVGYTIDHSINMTYDWRISPVILAEDLHDLVEAVCASTGADKVKLVGFSMGTCIVNSYISLYGYDRLDTVVYVCGAFNGLNSAGEPFAGSIDTSGNAIVNFLPAYLADDFNGKLITALVDSLNDIGLLGGVAKIAKAIVDANKEYVYSEGLAKLFCRWGSLWAFVPYEYYDDCMEFVEDYADLSDEYKAKIEYYHNEVQGKNEERIQYFLDHGIKTGIIAKYGYTTPPVVADLDENADSVIETKYASFGATCAKAGETLGDNYVQAVDDGHDHISADNKIDASTCKFPDITWFVKNSQHSQNSCLRELRKFIVMSDEQVDVFSDARFPQFLIADGDTVVPLTAETNEEAHTFGSRGIRESFSRMFALIRALIEWIKARLTAG